MAPPGTSFFPPQAVRKPVFDLTSDDPPVERDPDEDESAFRSNIPLSKVEMTSGTSRVEETPQKPSWDLSSYTYGNDYSRKRASDTYGSSTPPKRQKPMVRQNGPSRAMPVDLTGDDEMTLDDISDFADQRKVKRMQVVFTDRSVKSLYEALKKKKGHFDDACNYLADHASDDELLPTPKAGVARVNSNPVVKKTAQRVLKQPVKSLQDKYSKLGATQTDTSRTASPEVEEPKRKRKLVRGRKRTPSPSPEATPPRPQQQPKQQSKKQAPIVVSSDAEEDIDEGVVEIIDDDSDEDNSDQPTFEAHSLVNFFNTCTLEEMADLSGLKEEEISELFRQRPFDSLDAIQKIHVDLTPVEKGKKKARKPRITFGARLVEAAGDMWDAYSTIDSVVKQCENLGKPMVAGMGRWGIDIFGASTDEGVDLTALDDNSDASSSRDSGYTSPHGSDTETNIRKSATRTKLLKQPTNMNDDIELKDYQVVGLNWLNLLWQTGTSGILADDMGLGKTCQIIAFLSHLKAENTGKPALIVVPGSTLENWCREFDRFSKTIHYTPYYGSQSERSQGNLRRHHHDVRLNFPKSGQRFSPQMHAGNMHLR
jgi:SWI/SNF-related matrix-associated actin-dependent regulator 1 of chromatin subfamily A